MSRWVYLNGRYVREEEAKVSVFDRGLLFAEGVYEVTGVLDGKLIEFAPHMARLARSLSALGMAKPWSDEELLAIHRELVTRNGVEEGLVYLQTTRGAADRDFLPLEDMTPTLFLFTQEKPQSERRDAEKGVALKSVPDERWLRRDIKTTGLLAQVRAKQQAKAAGAYEALMHEEGVVTEGGATSFYFIRDGKLVTRPLSNRILPGVTRGALLALVAVSGLQLEERLFTLEETYSAEEAFITGASTYVCPVVEIDGHRLGNGEPGAHVRRLQEIYLQAARKESI